MALADWQRMTGYTEVGGHPDLSFRVADHPGASRVISWIEMPSATTSAGSAFAGVSPAVSLCESSHRALRLYARSPLV